MIDLGISLEEFMYGAISFAAITHGLDIGARRYTSWAQKRRWDKQDAEYAAAQLAAIAAEPVVETKTKKSK